MSECLITKLKEKVEDNNLLKIDEIVFVVSNEALNAIDNGGGRCDVRILTPNVTFEDGGTEEAFNGYASFVLSSYPARVAYSSKYLITKLNADSSAPFYPEDTIQLQYLSRLSHILTWSAKYELDLAVLKENTVLTQLNMSNNSLCKGDISNLSNAVSKLKLIRVEGTSVTGDLGSLIGLSNCTINVPSSVTYSQSTVDTLVAAGCTINGGTLL